MAKKYAMVGSTANQVKKRFAVIDATATPIKKEYAMVGSTAELVYNSKLSLLPPFPANQSFETDGGIGSVVLTYPDRLFMFASMNNGVWVISKDPIDFSSYNTIRIKYSLSTYNSGGWWKAFFKNASSGALTEILYWGSTGGRIKEYTVDISGVNGVGYLNIEAAAWAQSSIDLNIYELVFE